MSKPIHPALALCMATILVAAIPAQQSGFAQGAAGQANVSGKATFEGTPPRPARVRMDSDPLCAPLAKMATSETLLVGAGNGIRNVFVYVKDGLGNRTFPAPKTPVLLDQKGCVYTPHVFGVQVGQPINISNSDPAVHNVNATAKANAGFNLIQPKGTPMRVRTFDKPETMVAFRCDVHPWMASYAGVMSHPFFAVTGADGSFDIKGLPAGTYTLEAWHESLGTQTQKVVADGKKPVTANFTFKARK
jgi:hypothetical protein